MTTQEAKQVLDWIAEGKCEYKYGGTFRPYPNNTRAYWMLTVKEKFSDYRRAPEPKLRPWKPEEVPVGALIRNKSVPNCRVLICGYGDGRIWDATPKNYGRTNYTAQTALGEFEHSTDGGKTWSPCGVQE